ncbi:MAG: ATP-binding cassette domain-containing protein [Acidobacteria bacterium]|nr:ATP-binding cassette domain-containing protein [Acidobacteriota bacterium]
MKPLEATAPAVLLQDVGFGYGGGPQVLRVPHLAVGPGERVFVFGPSGCGKTTLLGLLAGVLQAQNGVVEVLGRDLSQLSPHERDVFRAAHLGYVFQLFNLIPYLTVLENIVLPCRISRERRERLGAASAEEAAAELAVGLGIDGLLGRPASELSVGQQQRAAAARALIGRPRLLIADEPTSSLDFAARDRFLELLLEKGREESCALVFVSHDRGLASLFDRTVSLPELNLAKRGG